MSSIYTPTATSHGSFVLPSDGDPAVAESVNDAFRDLADNALIAMTNAAAAVALASQMINGVTGGTYAPTSDIQISGANGGGFVVDGNFVHEDGTATFRSTSTMSVLGTAGFSGAVSFAGSSTITVAGALTVSGTFTAESLALSVNLTVGGSATIGTTGTDLLTVLAGASFEQPVSFLGTVSFDSAIEVTAPASLLGDVTLGNASTDIIAVGGLMQLGRRLTYSGSGRVPGRHVLLPASSATIAVADGDLFQIPTLSSGVIYTLSTSGAVAGDKMAFFTGGNNTLGGSVTFSGTATGEGGALMVAGRNSQFVRFVFDGSDWYREITSIFI